MKKLLPIILLCSACSSTQKPAEVAADVVKEAVSAEAFSEEEAKAYREVIFDSNWSGMMAKRPLFFAEVSMLPTILMLQSMQQEEQAAKISKALEKAKRAIAKHGVSDMVWSKILGDVSATDLKAIHTAMSDEGYQRCREFDLKMMRDMDKDPIATMKEADNDHQIDELDKEKLADIEAYLERESDFVIGALTDMKYLMGLSVLYMTEMGRDPNEQITDEQKLKLAQMQMAMKDAKGVKDQIRAATKIEEMKSEFVDIFFDCEASDAETYWGVTSNPAFQAYYQAEWDALVGVLEGVMREELGL